MTQAIRISDGSFAKIIGESDPQGDYELQPNDADIRVSTSKRDAREGRLIEKARPAILTKSESREAVWAYAPNGNVNVEIAKTRFSLQRLAPMTLRGAVQNRSDLTSFENATVGTSAVQLANNVVPDGFEALVQSDPGNGDIVRVGDSSEQAFALDPGAAVSLGVQNTDEIYVVADSGTQTVNVLGEA